MKPAVLDTNIILRYLLGDDQRLSLSASETIAKVRDGEQQVAITVAAVIECVFVLQKTHKVPRSQVATNLEEIIRFKGASGDDLPLLLDALATYRASNFSIVDAILLATAKRLGGELLTFDQQLAKRLQEMKDQPTPKRSD